MTDWTHYFKAIRLSHRMTKHDIVACCRYGGLEISGSRAEAWSRGFQGEKQARRSDQPNTDRRATAMTEAEFAAFCGGLVDWAREAYNDDADK